MRGNITGQALGPSQATRACEKGIWAFVTEAAAEGWVRNKDHMKQGFEQNTLALELGWGHPRFESTPVQVLWH